MRPRSGTIPVDPVGSASTKGNRRRFRQTVSWLPLATVRNTGTFLNLALVAREWLGARHQSIPGLVYLFLAALFGREAPGHPAAWAGVVTTSSEPEYWVFALVVVVAAVVVVVSVRRVAGRR
ncbi:hypothetical protein DEJ34_05830 [Curtobacterium sp. MCPF17_050]|nr:hypothetical protein [Curtobacterium sp. MCPF17_050]WIB17028.1 hypothetical protein DEJ34_05830 [Curtobacterium sp. MCPF17_050]